jgi:hypothetical protein
MLGSLEIGLKRTWFSPGDTMQGVVYLDVRDEPVKASRLTMKISGWEKSMVVKDLDHTEGTSVLNQDTIAITWQEKTPGGLVKYAQKKVLLNHYFNLCQFPNRQVLEGQYEFPFSLLIPSDLPNSFYKERQVTPTEKSKAKIRYKLSVEFDADIPRYKDTQTIKLIKSNLGRNIFALSSKLNIKELSDRGKYFFALTS